MASPPPNAAVAVPQHLQNAPATPSSYAPSSYSVPQVRLNANRDEWGLDIWQSLRAQRTREHPSLHWCTSNDYVKKRAVTVPPRLPYFDASSWCFVPEANSSNMQWDKCHLLSLPQELRLEIWKHVLTDPSVPEVAVEITREPLSPGKTSLRFPHPCIKTTIKPPRNNPISINILLTNDFIYREALPILYHSVRFAPLDVGAIFQVFLLPMSPFAQSHIRLVKLRIPSVVYETHAFSDRFTSLVNWAITCAQAARLDALRDVEVEGYSPQFTSPRVSHSLLKPLCKIKAKKTFDADINNEAQKALAEAARELQRQSKVRKRRTLSEAAERAERDATIMQKTLQQEEARKRTYSISALPATLTSTIERDLDQTGSHEFEHELQEHERSNSVFEIVSEDEVDTGIGEWEIVSLKSGACTPKARRKSAVEEESDEEVWSDTASTLMDTNSR